MKSSIVVFRRGLEDRAQWPVWLETIGFERIVDMPDRKGMTIAALGEDHWEASCCGVPLSEFGTLLFLGTPGAFSLPFPTDRERVYVHMEWEAALLAALVELPPGRVVNPGFVFAWNRTLFDPVHMLRDLARLGWWTPVVRRHFDLITGLVCKDFDPAPLEREKRLMVITDSEILFGDDPDEPTPRAFESASARATQMHLSAWGSALGHSGSFFSGRPGGGLRSPAGSSRVPPGRSGRAACRSCPRFLKAPKGTDQMLLIGYSTEKTFAFFTDYARQQGATRSMSWTYRNSVFPLTCGWRTLPTI